MATTVTAPVALDSTLARCAAALEIIATGGVVQEYGTLADFPSEGRPGVVYIAKDTNYLYRWDATAGEYEQIGGGGGSGGVTSVNGKTGAVTLTPADIGAEAVANKVTALTAQSTDTQYPSAKCVYDALQNAGGGGVTEEEATEIARREAPYAIVPAQGGGESQWRWRLPVSDNEWPLSYTDIDGNVHELSSQNDIRLYVLLYAERNNPELWDEVTYMSGYEITNIYAADAFAVVDAATNKVMTGFAFQNMMGGYCEFDEDFFALWGVQRKARISGEFGSVDLMYYEEAGVPPVKLTPRRVNLTVPTGPYYMPIEFGTLPQREEDGVMRPLARDMIWRLDCMDMPDAPTLGWPEGCRGATSDDDLVPESGKINVFFITEVAPDEFLVSRKAYEAVPGGGSSSPSSSSDSDNEPEQVY